MGLIPFWEKCGGDFVGWLDYCAPTLKWSDGEVVDEKTDICGDFVDPSDIDYVDFEPYNDCIMMWYHRYILEQDENDVLNNFL
eukprot:UN07450